MCCRQPAWPVTPPSTLVQGDSRRARAKAGRGRRRPSSVFSFGFWSMINCRSGAASPYSSVKGWRDGGGLESEWQIQPHSACIVTVNQGPQRPEMGNNALEQIQVLPEGNPLIVVRPDCGRGVRPIYSATQVSEVDLLRSRDPSVLCSLIMKLFYGCSTDSDSTRCKVHSPNQRPFIHTLVFAWMDASWMLNYRCEVWIQSGSSKRNCGELFVGWAVRIVALAGHCLQPQISLRPQNCWHF